MTREEEPMKTAGPSFINFLAANTEFVMAELYDITLADGMQLHYTTFDRNLVVGGTTACATKKFVRTSVGEVNGKVDSLGRSVEETQERTRRNEGKISEVDQKAEAAAQSATKANQAAARRNGSSSAERQQQQDDGCPRKAQREQGAGVAPSGVDRAGKNRHGSEAHRR